MTDYQPIPDLVTTVDVDSVYGIVCAICKHVMSQDALSCGSIPIRIEEAASGGVVISALQVIEAGFGVVVVAAVAEGINRCEGAGGG